VTEHSLNFPIFEISLSYQKNGSSQILIQNSFEMPIRERHRRAILMTRDDDDIDVDSVESTISRRGKWRICRFITSIWRSLCCFSICVDCSNESRRRSGRHGSRKRTSSLIVSDIDGGSSSGRTRRTSSIEAVQDDIIEIELSVLNRLGREGRNLVVMTDDEVDNSLGVTDVEDEVASSPQTGLIGAPIIGIYHSRLS
jgi:hypothetical protein